MPEPPNLVRAQLMELDARFRHVINESAAVTVQFNPESLRVSFANQVEQPRAAGDQTGPPSRQYVGAGTTKLALQLWFDVTAPHPQNPGIDDVRRLTERVAYFITPKANPQSRTQLIPPAVRFLWGTFRFDGIMDSLEETLEFFSDDGRPLRASLAVGLSQQKITPFAFGKPGAGAAAGIPGAAGAPGGGPPGTQPLTQAPAGSTVQGLAAAQGQAARWPAIAAANGIDNPRRLAPGQLLDMRAGSDIGSAAAALGLSAGGSAGVGASLSGSLGGSLSGGVGGSLSGGVGGSMSGGVGGTLSGLGVSGAAAITPGVRARVEFGG